MSTFTEYSAAISRSIVFSALPMPDASLSTSFSGFHRGASYTLERESIDRWNYSFSFANKVKSGTVQTRLGLLAVRRVRMIIDRALKNG